MGTWFAILACLAQDPPVEELLQAMTRRISQAGTLRVESTAVITLADGRAHTQHARTLVRGSDRALLDVVYAPDEEAAGFVAWTDGTRVRIHSPAHAPARAFRPTELVDRVRKDLVLFIDHGYFNNSGDLLYPHRPPDVGVPRDRGRVQEGTRTLRVLEIDVTWWRGPHSRKDVIRLLVDAAELRPFRLEMSAPDFRVVETVDRFDLDGQVPDEELALPWRRIHARARVGQLADAVAHYTLHAGVRPASFDDLLRRPAGRDANLYYPEGGYLPGGRVPVDPWGRPYLLREGRVHCLGADGQEGGIGDAADTVSPAPPEPAAALSAPSERLKRQFDARALLRREAAAVRAWLAHVGLPPAATETFREQPADVDAWPEGGWLPKEAARDPWGDPVQIVPGTWRTWIGLKDPEARALRAHQLTPEERQALEHAAEVRPPEDLSVFRALLARCTDDDLEVREAARREALNAGPRFRPWVDLAFAGEKDSFRRRWIAELQQALPVPTPAWRLMLGSLRTPAQPRPEHGAPFTAGEGSAIGGLRRILQAHHEMMGRDRKAWTGDLSGLRGSLPPGDPILPALLAAEPAAKDPAGAERPAPRPFHGYWFRAMTHHVEKGTRRAFADRPKGRGIWNQEEPIFATCATPSDYGVGGTRTWIMDSRGNLWWADLGGAAVLDWPTPEELEAAWKKVG